MDGKPTEAAPHPLTYTHTPHPSMEPEPHGGGAKPPPRRGRSHALLPLSTKVPDTQGWGLLTAREMRKILQTRR